MISYYEEPEEKKIAEGKFLNQTEKPWQLFLSKQERMSPDTIMVCDKTGAVLAGVKKNFGIDDEANAKLMRAAPELQEQLKLMVRLVESYAKLPCDGSKKAEKGMLDGMAKEAIANARRVLDSITGYRVQVYGSLPSLFDKKEEPKEITLAPNERLEIGDDKPDEPAVERSESGFAKVKMSFDGTMTDEQIRVCRQYLEIIDLEREVGYTADKRRREAHYELLDVYGFEEERDTYDVTFNIPKGMTPRQLHDALVALKMKQLETENA